MAPAMLCLWITALVGITMLAKHTRLRRGAHHDVGILEGAVSHEAPQATDRYRLGGRKESWTPGQARGDVFIIGVGALPRHQARPKTKGGGGAQPLPAGGVLLVSLYGPKTAPRVRAHACVARGCPVCLFPNFS
jgi:hypothetical protein